eukprot:gene19225-biopygen5938
MDSCHEEGVRDWNRAEIEVADPSHGISSFDSGHEHAPRYIDTVIVES